MKQRKTTLIGAPAAGRIFVDREKYIVLFNRLVDRLEPGVKELLVVHGIGGQGKTYLCNRLKDESTGKDGAGVVTAHLNLRRRELSEGALSLLWIRNELATRSNVSFDLFDLGLGHYWAVAHPDKGLPEFKGRGWLKAGIDAAVDNASKGGGSGFAQAGDIVVEGSQEALEKLSWTALLKAPIRKFIGKAQEARLRARFPDDFERLKQFAAGPGAASSLFRELPGLLARDLSRAAKERRFVVLIDEYELALEDRGAAATLHANPFDEAIRAFAAQADRTLIAVFSRERLPWGDFPPAGDDPEAWRTWIDEAHHALDGLAEHDALQWLEQVPVSERESARAMVVGASVKPAIAAGQPSSTEVLTAHPYLLELQVKHYQSLKASGAQIRPELFHSNEATFEGRRREFVMRLIGDYSGATQDLIRRLAVPRWFDRRTYDVLCSLAPAGVDVEKFKTFTRLSFVESRPPNAFFFQNAVREGLLSLFSPDDLQAIRTLLWNQARDSLRTPDEAANERSADVVEALHHGMAIQPREAIAWWGALRRQLTASRLPSWLVAADLEVVSGLEGHQPELRHEMAKALDHLGTSQQAVGQFETALEAKQRALSLRRQLVPPGSPALIEPLLELAEMFKDEEAFLDAEVLLDEAREVADAKASGVITMEHQSIIRTAASTLESQGLFRQAEPMWREMVAIARDSDEPASMALGIALKGLICNLVKQSRLDVAEGLMPEFTNGLLLDDMRPLWALRTAMHITRVWHGSLRPRVGRDLASAVVAAFSASDEDPDDEDDERCERRRSLGSLCWQCGDVPGAITWNERALQLKKLTPETRIATLMDQAQLLAGTRPDAAKSALDEAQRLATDMPHRVDDIVARVQALRARLTGGAEMSLRSKPVEISSVEDLRSAMAGSKTQARIVLVREVLEVLDRDATPHAMAGYRLTMADLLVERGDFLESISLLQEAWQLVRTMDQPPLESKAETAVRLCTLLRRAGRSGEGAEALSFLRQQLLEGAFDAHPNSSAVVKSFLATMDAAAAETQTASAPAESPAATAQEDEKRPTVRELVRAQAARLPERIRAGIDALFDEAVIDHRKLLSELDAEQDVPQHLRIFVLKRAAEAAESDDNRLRTRELRERIANELFVVYGGRDMITRMGLIKLSECCDSLGDWADGHKWRKKALHAIDLDTGEAAEFFAQHAPQLANDLVYLRNSAAAWKLLQRLHQLPERLLPASSPLWWDVHRASIRSLRDLGRLHDARETADRFLAALDQAGDRTAPEWKTLANCIAAAVAFKQGEHDAQRGYVDRARLLARSIDSTEFAWVQSTADLEAFRLDVCVDGAPYAVTQADAIVAGYAEFTDRPFYVSLTSELAEIAMHARDFKAAQRWLEHGIAACARILGENSATCLTLQDKLAAVRDFPDRVEMAGELRWLARVAKAADQLLALELSAWPWTSSARDDWRILTAEEVRTRLRDVIEAQQRNAEVVLPERYKIKAARARPLSFYPGAELIEWLVFDHEGRAGCFGCVHDQRQMVVLGGASTPIHNLNLAYRLRLEGDEAREIAYLRFFTSWIMGDAGPFTIVESPGEMSAGSMSARARTVATAVGTIAAASADGYPGRREFDAFVVYDGIAFRSRFRLGLGGAVTMTKDQRLDDMRMFDRWMVDGAARFLVSAPTGKLSR